MSKKALIAKIHDQFESQAAAERAIDAVTGGIEALVRGGELVVLRGFGTFKPKNRAERTARNPKTGEPIKIAARTVMAFKPNLEL